MIPILDTNKLDRAEKEIGLSCEQLLTPLTRFARVRPDAHFAIDNGAFTDFNEKGFRSLLKRELPNRDLCRFVAVPDVVGSARRTLEIFDQWFDGLDGWPLALVAQDGLEDMSIPWNLIQAIFIGGSTKWKMSHHTEAIIKAARICNKWVHIGRVNTPGRWEYFESLGANSFDGSGIARFSDMRQKLYDKRTRPGLFETREEILGE